MDKTLVFLALTLCLCTPNWAESDIFGAVAGYLKRNLKTLSEDQLQSINGLVAVLTEQLKEKSGNRDINQAFIKEKELSEDFIKNLRAEGMHKQKVYSQYVVNLLGIQAADLEMTTNDFCKSMPTICNGTYQVPQELVVAIEATLSKTVSSTTTTTTTTTTSTTQTTTTANDGDVLIRIHIVPSKASAFIMSPILMGFGCLFISRFQ